MDAPALLAAFLLAAGLAFPAEQQREFLTSPEVDQVREAQEAADRIKLYVKFAQVRLDTLDKELAEQPSSRAIAIHDMLYEYGRIMDAIDDVAESATAKRALVRKGLETVVKEAPGFLKRLKALEAKNPKDIEEYRFILRQAMETTESVLEGLREQLSKLPPDRKTEKQQEKEAKKKKEEK